MKAINQGEVQSWCEAHGYGLDSRGLPALRESTEIEEFKIPQDAGQRVALVCGHMMAFQQEEELCVWIYDWDVWPSGQWHHLFQRFRLSYGIASSLEEHPSLLIRKKDFEGAVSAVIYSVLMLWDCHVLSASGGSFLFYSHDEFGKRRK